MCNKSIPISNLNLCFFVSHIELFITLIALEVEEDIQESKHNTKEIKENIKITKESPKCIEERVDISLEQSTSGE